MKKKEKRKHKGRGPNPRTPGGPRMPFPDKTAIRKSVPWTRKIVRRNE